MVRPAALILAVLVGYSVGGALPTRKADPNAPTCGVGTHPLGFTQLIHVSHVGPGFARRIVVRGDTPVGWVLYDSEGLPMSAWRFTGVTRLTSEADLEAYLRRIPWQAVNPYTIP